MRKLLFVYDIENENQWKDGLSAAIKLLEQRFDLHWYNCAKPALKVGRLDFYDFILGWGGFSSRVDNTILSWSKQYPRIKKGLCLGGYGFPPSRFATYDVLFYEVPWAKKWADHQYRQLPNFGLLPEFVHAFGTNTQIFKEARAPKIWDFLSVGAFAKWKRHEKIIDKPGNRCVIGQIQKENLTESLDIIGTLLPHGVHVGDTVPPETLSRIYNATECVYIPAEVVGGGERAILEATHCGCKVLVEDDNPKLIELLKCDLLKWDEFYYADQIEKGIRLVL